MLSLSSFLFVITGGLRSVSAGSVPGWVGIYLIAINGVAFLVYGWDKSLARRGRYRVSEATLYVLALLGGWPGSLAGQQIFRHKTRKQRFQAVFVFIIVIQLLALWWFWMR